MAQGLTVTSQDSGFVSRPKTACLISMSPMMLHEYSSRISLTPLSTSVSSSWTKPWSSTSIPATSWTMAQTARGILDDFEVLPSIFQGWDINKIYNLGIDREESANAETDDEHIREVVASLLFTQESEAEARLAQTYHSNEESLLRGALTESGKPQAILRAEGCCLALWPNTTLSQVMSPTPRSKSAVRTLRSTTPPMSTASAPRVTIPPQSQLPRILTVFSSQRQPAAASIVLNKHRETVAMTHEMWENPGLAPTCVQASGNRCVVMTQFQV